MGSKALLFGAISLIVGVYAISLKNVQNTGMLAAQSGVDRMQNERVVDAALILALDKVKNTGGNVNTTVTGKHALGAEISYTISGADGEKANVSLTICKRDLTQKIIFTQIVKATVEKIAEAKSHKKGFRKAHRGKWQIVNAFVQHG